MSNETAFGTIDVEYALYTDEDGTFVPVTTIEDRRVESAVRAADTTGRVETSHDPEESSQLLHDHVVEQFYEFEYDGYRVALSGGTDSRWDPSIKDWRKVLVGAARVYPLTNANPAATKLWMNVWTRGALAIETAAGEG